VQRLIKQHQRTIDRARREMQREAQREHARQSTLQQQVSRAARSHRDPELQRAAVELVRSQRSEARFGTLASNMQALSNRITSLAATRTMMQTLQGVVAALASVNGAVSLPEMRTLLAELERQSGATDARQTMIDQLSGSLADVGAADSGVESRDPAVAEIVARARSAVELDVAASMPNAPSIVHETNTEELQLPEVPESTPPKFGDGNDDGGSGGGGGVAAVAAVAETTRGPVHVNVDAPASVYAGATKDNDAETEARRADLIARMAKVRPGK